MRLAHSRVHAHARVSGRDSRDVVERSVGSSKLQNAGRWWCCGGCRGPRLRGDSWGEKELQSSRPRVLAARVSFNAAVLRLLALETVVAWKRRLAASPPARAISCLLPGNDRSRLRYGATLLRRAAERPGANRNRVTASIRLLRSPRTMVAREIEVGGPWMKGRFTIRPSVFRGLCAV